MSDPENDTDCVVCYERCSEHTVCMHVVCASCIERIEYKWNRETRSRIKECPICRTNLQID